MDFKRIAIVLGIGVILFFLTFKSVGLITLTETPSSVTIQKASIVVLKDEFNHENTTDFLNFNNSELEQIKNLTLGNSQGKIFFNDIINLTLDKVGGIIDLDSNMEISNNFIEINSLVSLVNKSVILSFFGVNYNFPILFQDGVECFVGCNLVSNSGNIIIFEVNSFSNNYSIGQEVVESSDGSNGQIKQPEEDIYNFTLDKDLLKILVKQGETKREVIEIKNLGSQLEIEIEMNLINEFVVASEEKFILKKGESKIINFDFFAKENELAEAYFGRIIFKNEKIKKVVNVIFEIKEKKPLFDLKVDVVSTKIKPGSNVEAQFSIINMGDLHNFDILLYYGIKDFNGNTLVFREESIAIDDELHFSRKLKLPKDVLFGAYAFYSKINYKNITATGTDHFMIEQGQIAILNMFLLIFIFIFIFIIIYLKKKKKY